MQRTWFLNIRYRERTDRLRAREILNQRMFLAKNSLYTLFFPDVSYTKTERVRYSSSQTLPVLRTLLGCYSSQERLVDCAYHNFQMSTSSSSTTASMDVSISCQSSSDGETEQLSSVATASLSIAIICALAVVVLVAILIIMVLLRRRKSPRYSICMHTCKCLQYMTLCQRVGRLYVGMTRTCLCCRTYESLQPPEPCICKPF